MNFDPEAQVRVTTRKEVAYRLCGLSKSFIVGGIYLLYRAVNFLSEMIPSIGNREIIDVLPVTRSPWLTLQSDNIQQEKCQRTNEYYFSGF